MIKADVVVAEKRQIIEVPVGTKSEAIRVLWNTYGPGIDIKRWVEDEQEQEQEQEEVEDEEVEDETNSIKSDDANKSAGASGDSQGDILQADE